MSHWITFLILHKKSSSRSHLRAYSKNPTRLRGTSTFWVHKKSVREYRNRVVPTLKDCAVLKCFTFWIYQLFVYFIKKFEHLFGLHPKIWILTVMIGICWKNYAFSAYTDHNRRRVAWAFGNYLANQRLWPNIIWDLTTKRGQQLNFQIWVLMLTDRSNRSINNIDHQASTTSLAKAQQKK